ncbi:MAG: hypothetical protein JJU37_08310 [Balneolaceae bacterium]|nr:hypothetical protein [Balneolaceae bacterium]
MPVRLKTISILILSLLFIIPAYSQGFLNSMNHADSDTTAKEEKSDREIIIGPVADPYVYYDPFYESYRIQSGLFFGRGQFGVESTYMHPGSFNYVNLFIAAANVRDLSTPSSAIWISGLAVGRDFLLSEHERFMEQSSTDVYLRVGPGIGMAGRGIFDSRDSNFYLGLQTKALVGVQYNFSTQTSLYVHGGGRLLWFPALDEIRFTGLPVISIGLQFSSSPSVPMVRF